jgi:hypothetical protein
MPSDLPDRIRKMVVEQSRVEDLKRLTEENTRPNLEVGALINENRTARMQAEAAATTAEKIRMFGNQGGEVVAKAELFDEKVGIGSKPSGTRIALILTDYSEKLERVLVEMREVVNRSLISGNSRNDRIWEHCARREPLTFPTLYFRRRLVDFRQWRN